MKQPVVIAVAVVALLGSSMTGAAAAGGAVKGKHLPSVATTGGIYPVIEGGSSSTFKDSTLYIRAENCVEYDVSLDAPSGRYASYLTSDGFSPYAVGADEPTPGVYRFGSATAAKKAFKKVRASIEDCEGDHDGVTSEEIDVPRMGDSAIGHVGDQPELGGGFGAVNGYGNVWSRDGRTIINVSVTRDEGDVSKSRMIKMAKATLKSSS